MTFQQWLDQVDQEIRKRVFVGRESIPDVDYQGLFKTGNTPVEAAEYALGESDMTWRV